jgi:hypothetical protein
MFNRKLVRQRPPGKIASSTLAASNPDVRPQSSPWARDAKMK